MKSLKIKIHYSLIILLIIASFTGKLSLALGMMVILILHELGHLFFMHLFNVEVNGITFSIVGGMIDAIIDKQKGWQKLLIFRWRNIF